MYLLSIFALIFLATRFTCTNKEMGIRATFDSIIFAFKVAAFIFVLLRLTH